MTLKPETQKAVDEWQEAIEWCSTGKVGVYEVSLVANQVITAFTAELEAAQRELNSARAESKLHAQQRDQSQAACAQLRHVVEMWQEIGPDEESQTFVDAALKLNCGTGWKSPAEYVALEAENMKLCSDIASAENEVRAIEAKLAGAEACCAEMGKILQAIWKEDEMGWLTGGNSDEIECVKCGGVGTSQASVKHEELCMQNIIYRSLSTTCGQSLLEDLERLRKALELAKPLLKACFVGPKPPDPMAAHDAYEIAREALATVPEAPSK